jgi:hypothetical protein
MAEKTIVIIKCDRCGKEFNANPLEKYWFKPTHVYTKVLMHLRKKERIFERVMRPFDLCKECSESLADWLCADGQSKTACDGCENKGSEDCALGKPGSDNAYCPNGKLR